MPIICTLFYSTWIWPNFLGKYPGVVGGGVCAGGAAKEGVGVLPRKSGPDDIFN